MDVYVKTIDESCEEYEKAEGWYVQDGILTVYRKERFYESSSCTGKGRTYYPFEAHYKMEQVVYIKVIER